MGIRRNKDENNYWISYTDLMTGFLIVFIILTIVVYANSGKRVSDIKKEFEECDTTIAILTDSIERVNDSLDIIKVRLKEYLKLEEIKNSIKYIDTTYFDFNEKYKKHILNVKVQFDNEESDIQNLSKLTRVRLVAAGNKIKKLIKSLPSDQNIMYVIIVEGQASKDGWWRNDMLSYERALSLKKYWINNQIAFDQIDNCELIIAGSGEGGVPRLQPDQQPNNQRFLIQIIPKVGEIDRGLLE